MKVYKNHFSMFAPDVLSRGREYYKQGKVKILSETKNTVFAEVFGTSTYKVTIKFDENNQLIDTNCDCPYILPCKHKAAVLYELASKEIEVVKEKVDSLTERTYQTIKDNIATAYTRRSMELLKKAKDSFIKDAVRLNKDERISLAAYLVVSMHRSYYYGGEQTDIASCFEETVDCLGLQNVELVDFVAECLKPQDEINNYYLGELFSSFFCNEKYSLSAQEGFMRIYYDDKETALSIISSTSFVIPKKELPIYPPFSVALLKAAPVSVSTDYYKRSLEVALRTSDIKSIGEIVDYLKRTNNQKYIPEATYEYLAKHNHKDELKSVLMDSFLEYGSDFESYLRLRKYLSLEDFKELLPKVSNALMTKTFLNAVLFKDASFFPEYKEFFSIKKLTCKEIYLCKEDIDNGNKDIAVNLIKKRMADKKVKGKKLMHDLFYGLLYLDYIHDLYLEALVFEPHIINGSFLDKELRSIWLGIVSRNNLCTKGGIVPYEVSYVSK